MFDYEIVDTGCFGVNPRVINDGVYLISPKNNSLKYLSINEKSLSGNATCNFRQLVKEMHQYFYIKYYEKNDYYTIMPLNSHLLLGTMKKDDEEYDGSEISQNRRKQNFLVRWKIFSDNGFIFQLKNFDFCLSYTPNANLCLAAKKSNDYSQKFNLVPKESIPTGIYYIKSLLPDKSYITFNNLNNDSEYSYICPKDQKKDQLFYVIFDENDGCYSIININNSKCLEWDEDPNSQVQQSEFYNLDYQKWFIGTYDRKDYVIMHKSTNLFICNCMNDPNDSSLKFKNFNNIIIYNNLNHFYQFNSSNDTFFKKTFSFIRTSLESLHKEVFDKAKEKIKFRYLKEVALNFFSPNQNLINNHIFENSFILHSLEIPLRINHIHERALCNCKLIKFIKCHPKWLKLLPNPMNVENIVVPNGVRYIYRDYFTNFINLKNLSLPRSLKIINCEKNSFNEIQCLKLFDGDPIFLNIIPKDELEVLSIPSFVVEIPENSCAGCKQLKEVIIATDSPLKTIKSKAFENCILLRSMKIPPNVEDIAPDAFKGCNKYFNLKGLSETQKSSMAEKLVIEPNVTAITEYHRFYINISSIDIHLGVSSCNSDVLKSFKHLKNVKCDPKWLNDFETQNIEMVDIPDQITELKKHDFETLNNLKTVQIPNSVIQIEDGTFDNCHEIVSIKCSPNHFKYFNRKQIKKLFLNQEVSSLNSIDFNDFENLEMIEIPSAIQNINCEKFFNCKKLHRVDYPNGNSFINNSISIDDNKKEILKSDFEGWTNLEVLVIPKSITKIEEGAFDDCTNLKKLTCDPKWFPYIPKNSIRKVIIPDFVEEIKKGQFDDFYSMTCIKLPKFVTIDDGTIFDPCESLKIIKCKSTVFSRLSDKTIERCDQKIKNKYENPIFNFQPDPSKVFDETNIMENNLINDPLSQSLTNSIFMRSSIRNSMETTIDELIEYEPDANLYKNHIENVLNMIHKKKINEPNKPNDTSISEISNICGFICNKISKKPLGIITNVVQIYAILRLVDDILNSKEDLKGSVAEVKPGEGKTLITTIVAIICVKYGYSIDIVASSLQRAKRDQKDQKAIFDMFDIPSSVFYDRRNDSDLITASIDFVSPDYLDQYKDYDQSEFNNFNLKALECPVVYSTSRNFQYYYLQTMFSMIPRKRELDIVLINEVDNMLIDELDTPTAISKEVHYALFDDIFKLVYSNRFLKLTEIIAILKTMFPDASDYNEDDFYYVKFAALEADNKTKDIDYVIIDNKVVIIDRDSGLQMPNSHWPIYLLQMVEIKERITNKNIIITPISLSICQLTQQTYFKLYKKIAAVTGTLGSSTDESILKEEYSLNTFKVPRNILIQIEVYYKNRPESIDDIFDMVHDEIISQTEENRPVLVIWDSKYNAEKFMNSQDLGKVGSVLCYNQIDDELGIDIVGEPGSIIMTNSIVCKNLDVKPTKESLEAGGLHVIIPMKISNLRSFEQAVGQTGKNGQPGSVSIFISKNDLYIQTPSFNKRNDNLVRLQNMFVEHIKTDFPWMLCGHGKRKFPNDISLPFAADYECILKMLYLLLCFSLNKDISNSSRDDEEKFMKNYQDLTFIIIQTAWASFYEKIKIDKLNSGNWTYCEKEYNRFLKTFHIGYLPEINKTLEISYEDFLSNINYLFHKLIVQQNYFIFQKRYKISSSGIRIVPVNDIDYVYNQFKDITKNDNKSRLSIFFEILISACRRTPGPSLLFKSPKIDIKCLDVNFVRFNMILAKESYDCGQFSIGNVIFASEVNGVFKPKFYCVEFFNKIFVVTRGSDSDDDYVTDSQCQEECVTFGDIDIYFHHGFLSAAKYVLFNITEIIERDYDEIYFVGHSYGAAVSNVLCLLTKMQKKFENKKIYSFAFAPPPAMSKIPAHIQDCMYLFINKRDIVPHTSMNNLKNTLDFQNIRLREIISTILRFFVKPESEHAKKLEFYTEKYTNEITLLLSNVNTEFHVHKNMGNIFLIGLSDTTKLKNCQIDETDLPDAMFVCAIPTIKIQKFELKLGAKIIMFEEHKMVDYIKSFSIIKSYD